MVKTITQVSLPKSVIEQVDTVANELNKSRGELITEAVIKYLDAHLWRKMQDHTRTYATARGVQSEWDVNNLLWKMRQYKYGKR